MTKIICLSFFFSILNINNVCIWFGESCHTFYMIGEYERTIEPISINVPAYRPNKNISCIFHVFFCWWFLLSTIAHINHALRACLYDKNEKKNQEKKSPVFGFVVVLILFNYSIQEIIDSDILNKVTNILFHFHFVFKTK